MLCTSAPFSFDYLAPLLTFRDGQALPAAVEISAMRQPTGELLVMVHQGIVGVHFELLEDSPRSYSGAPRIPVPSDIKPEGLEWLQASGGFRDAVMTIGRSVAGAEGYEWDTYRGAFADLRRMLELPADSPLRYQRTFAPEQTPEWFDGRQLPRRYRADGLADLSEKDRYVWLLNQAGALQTSAAMLGDALSRPGIMDYLGELHGIEAASAVPGVWTDTVIKAGEGMPS